MKIKLIVGASVLIAASASHAGIIDPFNDKTTFLTYSINLYENYIRR